MDALCSLMKTLTKAPTGSAELLELGFVEAGSWSLVDEQPQVNLTQHREVRPALYALVEDDTIMYVGKSMHTLRQRMKHLQTPGLTQPTNRRNCANIASSLGAGLSVKVFVLVCGDTPVEYRGIQVDLAAGLQEPLIAMFRPAWNMAGNAKD
jgi:hypothetical protein